MRLNVFLNSLLILGALLWCIQLYLHITDKDKYERVEDGSKDRGGNP